jgi:hypothetical protein
LSRLFAVLARRPSFVHAVVAIGLFAWAFGALLDARPRVPFHGDESDWISTSRYFGTLFLERNTSPDEWSARVLRHALVNRTWSGVTLGIPLDVPLTAGGLVALCVMAVNESRRTPRVGPAMVFLLWLHAYLFGTIWGYSLDWNRYVVPVYLFTALTSGIGLSMLIQGALKLRSGRAIRTLGALQAGLYRPGRLSTLPKS